MFANPNQLSTTCAGVAGKGLTRTRSAARAGTDNRPLDEVLNAIEKREIVAALRRANGQRTKAARLLSISRSRLYRRMEALGIDPRSVGAGRII